MSPSQATYPSSDPPVASVTRVGRKTCCNCYQDLPASAFQRRSRATDGLDSRCRYCRKLAYQEKHPPKPVPEGEEGDYWVYRIYNEDGALLYIGRTQTALRRLAQHKYGQDWSRQIARIEVEHFDYANFADLAEREAIATEKPPFNTTFTSEASEPPPPGAPKGWL